MAERRRPLVFALGLLLLLSLIAMELARRARAQNVVQAACEEGMRLEARGLFAEAARSFEICLKADPSQAAAWRGWAESLLRARGRPAYEEVRTRLRRFVERARNDPRTDRAELQAVEDLILDLEELLAVKNPAEHSGAWTVEEIVEILTRLRGRSRYDGPRVPLQLDFLPGDASLGQVAEEQLRDVAMALRDGLLNGVPIVIEGHSDSVEAGSEAARRVLARKRAEAVRDFLVRECGIPATQLHVISLADKYPLKPNSSGEGRAANRRVELVNMESKQQILKDIRARH